MHSHPGSRRIAVLLAVVAVFLSGPAGAADTGNGSKNFRTPPAVPNYFSNEAGPMLGPAAETRRGPLYATESAVQPQATARVAAAPPRGRTHIAMAEPRGRAIRGRAVSNRHGGRLVPHHVTVHGRPVHYAVAHGSSRGRTAHAVATRAPSRARVGVSTHRRGRV